MVGLCYYLHAAFCLDGGDLTLTSVAVQVRMDAMQCRERTRVKSERRQLQGVTAADSYLSERVRVGCLTDLLRS